MIRYIFIDWVVSMYIYNQSSKSEVSRPKATPKSDLLSSDSETHPNRDQVRSDARKMQLVFCCFVCFSYASPGSQSCSEHDSGLLQCSKLLIINLYKNWPSPHTKLGPPNDVTGSTVSPLTTWQLLRAPVCGVTSVRGQSGARKQSHINLY